MSEDIASSSDEYEPDTYLKQLNFFDQLQLVPEQNVSYIPLSAVKVNDPKYFVFGIIPPATNITDNLLDRSGTIGGGVEATPETSSTSGSSGPRSVNGVVLTKKSESTNPSDRFWDRYVEMAARLKLDPTELGAAIYSESGFQPSAQNVSKKGVVVAQGLNQLQRGVALGLGMSPETWNNYATLSGEQQLPWVEKYFKASGIRSGASRAEIYQKNAGGYKNPDGSIYASLEYINSHPEKSKFPDPKGNDLCFRGNKGLSRDGQRIMIEDLDARVKNFPPESIRQRIEAAKARLGAVPNSSYVDPSKVQAKDPSNGLWKGEGDKNAKAALDQRNKVAGQNVNSDGIGRLYQQAQAVERKALQISLEKMRNTPPLRLMVNPTSFKTSDTKTRNDGNMSRKGAIVQTHSNGQTKLDISGKIAGFYAIDVDNETTGGEAPGLTRVARHWSAGYQNFLSLFLLYKNNGRLFTYDESSNINLISMVGSVYIYYDGHLYLGSFDNLNVTESDTSQFQLEYNIQFTCRAVYTLDVPNLERPTRVR